MNECMTLVDTLRQRAQLHPEKRAFIFLDDGESERGALTYGELSARAGAIATVLARSGHAGERALLLVERPENFIVALFGCLYARAVAVPAYLPSNERSMRTLQPIIESAQVSVVLYEEGAASRRPLAASLGDGPLRNARWVAVDRIGAGEASPASDVAASPDELAILLYTSGSTSDPRGVMVTHRNLLACEKTIQTAFGHGPDLIGCGWLPLFHDMGLMGVVLQTVFAGGSTVIFKPAAFVQRPIRWLKAISTYGVTSSGGPNFAFELCAQRIRDADCHGLDLSSWRVAFCGAEPIAADTLDRFTRRFSRFGFDPRAILPCYGLAEATLFVSGGPRANGAQVLKVDARSLAEGRVVTVPGEGGPSGNARSVVSVGQIAEGHCVAVVDPGTLQPCDAGVVGEVFVRGPHVASGYWVNLPQSAETFDVRLAGADPHPYLRTGDLGFVLHEQLYITGRAKELIIIRGRNLYPADIEATVRSTCPAAQIGSCAAFGMDDGQAETLCVVVEASPKVTGDELASLARAIEVSITEEHSVALDALYFVPSGAVPKTSSGKVQRLACRRLIQSKALPVLFDSRTLKDRAATAATDLPEDDTPAPKSLGEQEMQQRIAQLIGKACNVPPGSLDVDVAFTSLGLDSIQCIQVASDLAVSLNVQLPETILYDTPSIRSLAGYLANPGAKAGARSPTADVAGHVEEPSTLRSDAAFPAQDAGVRSSDQLPSEQAAGDAAGGASQAIAIVGMACRFPGAGSVEDFWKLLANAGNAVTEIPEGRWRVDDYFDSRAGAPGKMITRFGGFLSDVEEFDAPFFGLSAREVHAMDPQQRIVLEVAVEALNHAAHSPDDLNGRDVGVFIGLSSNDFLLLKSGSEDTTHIDGYTGTGTSHNVVSGRLSYILGLNGPSIAIDTACSSSLVSVHLACQSLRTQECEMAIAGGVNVLLAPESTISLSQAGMLAPDGKCKAFDASADGYVRAEGCGIVILKRLADARRNGDNILAVIRGSAVNQNGRSNGLTAPNSAAQKSLMRSALKRAGVTPREISYVEAHGTGTAIGDPIEVAALTDVMMTDRPAGTPCWLGAVKTNIGHLESAAGVAGLIKTVLALQHQQIPANLHFSRPNPRLGLQATQFSVPQQLTRWDVPSGRRIAGVSSFGFSGTNAHVVVEEAPGWSPPVDQPDRNWQLLTLSARDARSLRLLAERFAGAFTAAPDVSLGDTCYSANTGRTHLAHRIALIGTQRTGLAQTLRRFAAEGSTPGLQSGVVSAAAQPRVAFMFTGQGSQYTGMGRKLFDTQPVFRQSMQHCDELLRDHVGLSILSLIWGETEQKQRLHQTMCAQPALFALEYSLAQLWMSWGVKPAAVLGHSLGEYVAACVAGVFSLEDALAIVAARGRLMQSAPGMGGMVAILADPPIVQRLVVGFPDVSIAADNGSHVVVSGGLEVLRKFVAAAKQAGVPTRDLQTSHAFHSSFMDSILEPFAAHLRRFTFREPQIPMVSNLTGELITPTDERGPAYWCRHLREPVKFRAGLNALIGTGVQAIVEVGPEPVLSNIARGVVEEAGLPCLPSLHSRRDNWETLLESVAALYVRGVSVDWRQVDHGFVRHRVALPSYVFAHERYPLPVRPSRSEQRASRAASAGTSRIRDEELVLDVATRGFEPQLSAGHSAELMERRVNGAAGGEESAVSSEMADAEQEDVLSRLLQLDQSALQAAIRDQLQSQIATMLRVSPEQLAVDAPLVSLGMDSLLAVELMFHVMRTYRIKLDFASLMTVELSIATLAVIVTQHVQEGSTSLADTGEEGFVASPLDPDSGDIDIDSLSDAEVDAALARLSR